MASLTLRSVKGTQLTNNELDANFSNLNTELASKQNTLVSGTSIKTVNGVSVLGSGNIQIDGGVTSFNSRTGAVTLSSGDVTGALGFTPVNKAGDTITGNLAFSGTGLRITGDFSNATRASRLLFQTSTANSNTFLSLIPNGTGGGSGLDVHLSGTDPDNTAFGRFAVTSASVNVRSGVSGTGTQLPMDFYIGSSIMGRLSTAGNWLFGTTADNATDKIQVVGSVSATSFSGSGANLTGLTSGQITTALGFTPYNATNPSGYITNTGNARVGVENNGTLIGTRRNINFIPGTGISLSISDDAANEEVDVTITSTAAGGVTSFNTRTGAVSLSSGDVTGALGFTPYNSTNPSGYITSSFSGFMLRSTSPQTNPNTNFSSSAYRFDPNANNPTNEHYAIITYGNESNVTGQLATHFVSGQTFTRAYNSAWSAWRTQLDSVNYTSYSPSLTGSGASGNWGINVTGSSGSVSGLTINNASAPINPDNVTQNQIGYNTSVSLFGQSDGGLYSSSYSSSWIHQIYGDFRTGQIAIRGKNSGTWQAWRTVLDSSNYTSYSPSLGGSGASGTWGISVTGSSSSTTFLSSPDGDRVAGNKLPTSNPRTVRFDFATAGSVGSAGNYAGVMTYAPWDGTSASTGDSSYQLAFTNQSGVNASGPAQLLLRNGINGSWNGWQTILSSSNYTSYSPSLSGSGASGTWGINITGNAATVASRSVGTGTDNIAFLNGSRNIVTQNPETYSGEVRLGAAWNRGGVYASSTLSLSTSASEIHFVFGDVVRAWVNSSSQINAPGGYISNGNPWGTSNSAYFPNGISTAGGTNWIYGNSYIGNAPSNGAGHELQSNGNMRSTGQHRATIYYDDNDTGYYCDPNGNSNLNTINGRGAGSLMYYQGFTLDANTMNANSTGFTYAVNAPAVGPVARFSTGGGYDLWLNAAYGGGGTLFFRTRNGDAGSMNAWRACASYGINYGDSLFATIYYDANDTGYYVNPNGYSQMSAVWANDWFRPQGGCGVYWESYGRGIRAADNEFSYGHIGTYGSGLNGWRGYGVFPNNFILMSNGSTHGFYAPSPGIWLMNMDTSGNVVFNGNVTAYSDLRLKDNVRDIDGVLARRDTLAKAAIKYERDGRTRIGYGAQILRDNGCAEFVMEADDALKLATGLGTLSVDYGETAAILAVASKMTDDRVANLEAKIARLEAIIEKLIGD